MHRNIIITKDVTFKENMAYRKSHHLPPIVIKDERDEEAPKVEKHAEDSNLGSQPLGGVDLVAPSISIRRPNWF